MANFPARVSTAAKIGAPLNREQARHAVWIFEQYAAGKSPRQDPDSGKRLVVAQRPPEEWKRHPAPELRIVPEELWERVQARLVARRADTVPLACRSGRRERFASRGGRRHKYALSGLLKCAECGANYSLADVRM